MEKTLAVTVPLDELERLLALVERYCESEGGFAFEAGDVEAFNLLSGEVEAVKAAAKS